MAYRAIHRLAVPVCVCERGGGGGNTSIHHSSMQRRERMSWRASHTPFGHQVDIVLFVQPPPAMRTHTDRHSGRQQRQVIGRAGFFCPPDPPSHSLPPLAFYPPPVHQGERGGGGGPAREEERDVKRGPSVWLFKRADLSVGVCGVL